MNHKGVVVGRGGGSNAGDTRRADTVATVLKFSLLACVIDEERERIQERDRGGLAARRGA